MRNKKPTPPTNISAGLFMDLAFLLIAALVLLINEPVKEEARREKESLEAEKTQILEKLNQLELRESTVKEVVQNLTEGESIFLRLGEDGSIFEIPEKGEDRLLDSQALIARIEEMPRPRYAVLHVEPTVPYDKFSPLRDRLQELKAEGKLDHCLEIAKK